MSDVDRERLAVPVAHSVFSQHTNPSSYSGASAAPPFAPHPHYGQQIRQQQRLHSTTGSSRSGATSAHTDRIPSSAISGTSSASTTECNIHEVCYYFQQAIFILAILTGVTLVIAGAVMHVQNGELLVLVYIGVLLGAVNTVLLTIQCCVRRKQKKRARAYRATRQSQGSHTTPSNAVVRYDPLSNPLLSATHTVPPSDVQQYHYKHYHIHPPSQQAFQDFPVPQGLFAQSPTESSQTRMHHNIPMHRSGGHHRITKASYQKSPPLGQAHRPLLNTLGPQQGVVIRSDMGSQEAYKTTVPANYDDLLRCGRHTQDGTTVHLI
ncbi:uncharacterized protein [Parasteatoda tepidariorum]|uniref:uncharacterized protein n=1 Tax=Parasteatoda tepidariorum TaxID=114398 RepID=UPI00077FAC58|nr:uncharacterized protein LOC107446977 [Parasteatoda tepidariorum]XP_042910350.1 uncharacterized protein LOC107446977 [Parasteatoda tepidariorum]